MLTFIYILGVLISFYQYIKLIKTAFSFGYRDALIGVIVSLFSWLGVIALLKVQSKV